MRKLSLSLSLITLITAIGGVGSAYAKTDFYVKNCSGKTVTFTTASNNETNETVQVTLDGLVEDETDSNAKRTYCKQRGKKCQVSFKVHGAMAKDGGDVKSYEYFIVTDASKKVLQTKGEYVTSRKEKKCSDL